MSGVILPITPPRDRMRYVLGFSSTEIDTWSTQFRYISLFACEYSHCLCTCTRARPREPANVSAARMRALEGGRDILNWVCVRGIQPHVWWRGISA
jgi:hypothetical protein